MKNYFTLPKIIMMTGALSLLFFSILVATNIITPTFFNWKTSWEGLFFISFFYILIPFSVKPGWISRAWALTILTFSVLFLIGLFTGQDLKNWKVYINVLPHILMAAGSLLWIFNAK